MKIKRITTNSKLKNVREFIEKFEAPVLAIYNKYKFPPAVLLAQIALETGWGKKVLKGVDRNGNKKVDSKNLFNITVGKNWKGNYIYKKVLEYNGIIPYRTTQKFRAYKSYQQSIDDYVKLISGAKRYKMCMDNLDNNEKYVNGLVQGGYATAPNYKKVLIKIMDKYIFVEFDIEYQLNSTNGIIMIKRKELQAIRELLNSTIRWMDKVLKGEDDGKE